MTLYEKIIDKVGEEAKLQFTVYCVTSQYTNGNIKVQHKVTLIYRAYNGQNWKFEHMDPRFFEVFHGLSRISKLLPDKLHLALDINKEMIPKDLDDGSFLIKLVEDMIKFYEEQREQLNNQLIQHQECNILSHTAIKLYDSVLHTISMRQVVHSLSTQLKLYKKQLANRNIEALTRLIPAISIFAKDLYKCYSVYEILLDYIHTLDRHLLAMKSITNGATITRPN